MVDSEKLCIAWFRRDLRLADNAMLAAAFSSKASVLPLFIFDTNILNELQDRDDRRISFIWQSVNEMRERLRELQSDLLVLFGNPVDLIPKIARLACAQTVFINRDYESYALSRDRSVTEALQVNNVKLMTFKDHVIFEASEVLKGDGGQYTVFTPYKRSWLRVLTEDSSRQPIAEHFVQLDGTVLKSAAFIEELRLLATGSNIKVVEAFEDLPFCKAPDAIAMAGRMRAVDTLRVFCQQKMARYAEDRDVPSKVGTSNLSVHLRFGTISVREAVRAVLLERDRAELKTTGYDVWLSELIWRDFYSAILQAFPIVEGQAFKSEYRNLTWRADEALLGAWQRGLTGYPIVDAGMRQLVQTGFMHNRLRMITASFLTKDLLLDWRLGEAFFARHLLDFDLASNNGGWQWAASTGTDAVPYFRIFNPKLQGQRFDPDARYIKTYVPELSGVAPERIHSREFDVAGYPRPIVRHEEVKEAVKNLFLAAKSRTTS